jgi:hypothetical protein
MPQLPTWTEAHRHACEVRYVVNMPTREARRDYLEGVTKKRGEPAGQALADAVRAAWVAARTPAPVQASAGPAAATGVHPGEPPGSGSFLEAGDEDHSNPVRPVDSGVSA